MPTIRSFSVGVAPWSTYLYLKNFAFQLFSFLAITFLSFDRAKNYQLPNTKLDIIFAKSCLLCRQTTGHLICAFILSHMTCWVIWLSLCRLDSRIFIVRRSLSFLFMFLFETSALCHKQQFFNSLWCHNAFRISTQIFLWINYSVFSVDDREYENTKIKNRFNILIRI